MSKVVPRWTSKLKQHPAHPQHCLDTNYLTGKLLTTPPPKAVVRSHMKPREKTNWTEVISRSRPLATDALSPFPAAYCSKCKTVADQLQLMAFRILDFDAYWISFTKRSKWAYYQPQKVHSAVDLTLSKKLQYTFDGSLKLFYIYNLLACIKNGQF